MSSWEERVKARRAKSAGIAYEKLRNEERAKKARAKKKKDQKQEILNQAYKKARHAATQRLSYWRKKGKYQDKQLPKIPKKITEASIRKISGVFSPQKKKERQQAKEVVDIKAIIYERMKEIIKNGQTAYFDWQRDNSNTLDVIVTQMEYLSTAKERKEFYKKMASLPEAVIEATQTYIYQSGSPQQKDQHFRAWKAIIDTALQGSAFESMNREDVEEWYQEQVDNNGWGPDDIDYY